MNSGLDTQRFWEDRLRTNPNLRGTGHRAFDLNYNQWLYQAQWDSLDLLFGKHQVKLQGRSVLDVGSGTGFYLGYYIEHGAEPIYGLDITETSVQYLQKTYPQGYFSTCDISEQNLPLQRSFGLVSAMSVLYHVVDDARFESAVTNLCTHLDPGGYLLLTDTFRRSLVPTARHARFRSMQSYQTIFARHNITVLDVLPIYYLMNRTFIPIIGPSVINAVRAAHLFYIIDNYLRRMRVRNSGIKMLLAQKSM